MDRKKSAPAYARCEHASYPVEVVSVEDGKIAYCLGCGESGPVHEKSVGALLALRDKAHRRWARRA